MLHMEERFRSLLGFPKCPDPEVIIPDDEEPDTTALPLKAEVTDDSEEGTFENCMMTSMDAGVDTSEEEIKKGKGNDAGKNKKKKRTK